MVVAKDEPRLAAAATQRFGSYPAAVAAAGFNYRKLCPLPDRRNRTEEQILDRIRNYMQEGCPLDPAAVIKYDNALYVAARRYGGWRAVTHKAGVPAELVTFKRSHCTRAEAIAALQQLARAGQLMGSKRMRRHPTYRSLFYACSTYWGGLPAAARAAGIEHEYAEQVYAQQGLPAPRASHRRRRNRVRAKARR